ncbi:hypothetical protein SAMN05216412_10723 [Nitrosospira multiformis]|uniref:Uncharacterized protein n=1 Tax=Nitrosospira multiformis TaxID=1231 RepID=A0A1I0EP01_9PROT|nr:hypothetical protein SAMN05216412_10723 [Nitrosospira multiformis]
MQEFLVFIIRKHPQLPNLVYENFLIFITFTSQSCCLGRQPWLQKNQLLVPDYCEFIHADFLAKNP